MTELWLNNNVPLRLKAGRIVIESGEPPLFVCVCVLMRRMSMLHLDHLIHLINSWDWQCKARPYFIFSIHNYTKPLLLLWSCGLRRIYRRQQCVSDERKLKKKKKIDACLLFKDYHMNSAPYLSIQVAEGFHRSSWLPGWPCFCRLAPPSRWSITPSSHLSEMEERILAVETRIDPLGRSPHPNLLTPAGK